MIHINKLISISSHPLGMGKPIVPERIAVGQCKLISEHYKILESKNGFYAFESALHFFPSGEVQEGYSLEEWNSINKWRGKYNDLTEGLWFFAEDLFGEQFAIDVSSENICRFNPETADCEKMADNFDDWAQKILDDYNAETGYSLAHEWQSLYGTIPIGHRLVPRKPFVLGGQFDINNLVSMDALEGMFRRAEIAIQIHDLPDGSKIHLSFEE